MSAPAELREHAESGANGLPTEAEVLELVQFLQREQIAYHWTDTNAGENAKRCTTKGWPDKARVPTADAEDAARLFRHRLERKNPLIPAAKSGLLVVECDSPADAEKVRALGLPKTFEVRSGREGGLHLYFRAPEGATKHAILVSEGQAKSNQYLVGPLALHPNGRRYQPTLRPVAELTQGDYALLLHLVGSTGSADPDPVDADPLDELDVSELPRLVALAMNDAPREPRWRQVFEFVNLCYREGVPVELTLAAVLHYPPAVDKHREEGYDAVADARRIWAKLEADSPGAEAEASGNGASTFVGIDLSDTRPERINWWVEGLIPKSLHVALAAPGGTVKGLFSMYLAAEHIPGPVLYLGSEDDYQLILVPRALALGLDPSRFVPLLKSVDGVTMPLRFPSDQQLLLDAIRHYSSRLFVVDSGVEHMDAELNPNAAGDVRQFTSCLNAVCQETRATALDILHTNKDRNARGSGRIAHAKTWIDASRHALLAARDDEDEDVRHVEVVKTNIGHEGYARQYRILTREVPVWDVDLEETVDDPQPYLVDEGESTKSVEALLSGDGEKAEGVDEAILRYLGERDPLAPSSDDVDKDVAKRTGKSPRTVKNHRLALNKAGLTQAAAEMNSGQGGGAKVWATKLTELGRARLESAEADW